MKKFHYILSLIAVIMVLQGCSSSDKNLADTDTIAADSAAALQDDATDALKIEISAGGIANVIIGDDIADLGPEMEGVYDSIASEDGYESRMHVFFLNGEQRFTAYEFRPGKIDMVSADHPDFYVINVEDNDSICLGSGFAKVLALPGVKASWESADDEGMWCWVWNGLWFQPDQMQLSEALSRKLYNPEAAPEATDFAETDRVGYIGTGLPW